MSISESLTQQRLQEILLHTYKKGHTSKEINIIDFLEEIKQQLLDQTSEYKGWYHYEKNI